MLEEAELLRKTSESISDFPESLQEQIENNEAFDVLSGNFSPSLDLQLPLLQGTEPNPKTSYFDLQDMCKNRLDKIDEVDSEQNYSKTTEHSFNTPHFQQKR